MRFSTVYPTFHLNPLQVEDFLDSEALPAGTGERLAGLLGLLCSSADGQEGLLGSGLSLLLAPAERSQRAGQKVFADPLKAGCEFKVRAEGIIESNCLFYFFVETAVFYLNY